ncbi:MAG: DNA-binding protein [Acetobacteraceae bacterium]|nr:DNA-binding protein [Acetobacteraceae bacterium]
MHPIDRACIISGCGRTKIYHLIALGLLDARKLGRRTLVTDESLRRFLAGLPPLRGGRCA